LHGPRRRRRAQTGDGGGYSDARAIISPGAAQRRAALAQSGRDRLIQGNATLRPGVWRHEKEDRCREGSHRGDQLWSDSYGASHGCPPLRRPLVVAHRYHEGQKRSRQSFRRGDDVVISGSRSGSSRTCSRVSGRQAGVRIVDFHKAWMTPCRKAGVPGRVRHHVRRTVRNRWGRAYPSASQMKVTGHRTRAVFDRCHIVSPADLQDVAQRLAGTFRGTPGVAEVDRRALTSENHSDAPVAQLDRASDF
jgi:hypothetical protein